jgi:integration host factor subunit alpha
MVLNEICDAIVRGETVKLSSFATFHVREKSQRIGRNPKTGEEVPILPRRVMTFKASNVLKTRIMEGHRTRLKREKEHDPA